ncbi:MULTISPECIES: JmjC domain-containing protein [Streptomycetaceae]|uniref:Cupin 4 family protein n=1 Tax=Streptantibioticus cattleyicolor (strain ATCC 35852 / DSM 46488 / JCM 4925 / NBRC 14057 / NRRL 8057) TaxID=1003195 RepID=F8JR06_STREN|nr:MULTISPECIES: cupin domain-containing protein [Streptomycetaceae]AEW94089.1 cupin 4 family protein [Streptantibioticus cattleyicolor NRRL 8057 = DSM 46488]MYS58759.1 cupin [Streptomyces sp. SID5468]CCB74444.1 protein of unknown function [Streptantibioticus cattleyicolor NRRL 8057 = DSM 46488]
MSLQLIVDDPAVILRSWPHEPLRFRRDPAEFGRWLTLAEVDTLIDAGCLAMRNVVLLKDGRVSEKWEYADPDDPTMPRCGAVREHIKAGGSVSLRELEHLKPSVADLYRALCRETGYGVHINAYLTPPGCQGLKYHFDPYVTLILQIHGRKTWPVHPPFVANPVQEYGSFHLIGFTPEQRHYLAHTPPAATFTLAPGDVLWLPRGYVHSPYTEGSETSLHITVAFKERTYHWAAERLAEDILRRALADPEMREELPPHLVTLDTLPVVEQARDYLIGALLSLDPETAVKYLQRSALVL